MNVKKTLLIVMALTLPVLLGLRVAQVHRYRQLVAGIEELDDEQREWLERNKRLLAGIAVFSSPRRIEELARERLELTDEDKGPWARIEFGDGDGR